MHARSRRVAGQPSWTVRADIFYVTLLRRREGELGATGVTLWARLMTICLLEQQQPTRARAGTDRETTTAIAATTTVDKNRFYSLRSLSIAYVYVLSLRVLHVNPFGNVFIIASSENNNITIVSRRRSGRNAAACLRVSPAARVPSRGIVFTLHAQPRYVCCTASRRYLASAPFTETPGAENIGERKINE